MRLFRRRRDGIETGPWIMWGYDSNKRRYQRSTKCHDREAADMVARRWERQAAMREPLPVAIAPTLAGAFALLLMHRRELVAVGKRSPWTVTMLELHARHWCGALGGSAPLANLRAVAVDRYVSMRRAAKVSDHTIVKELSSLRAALRRALRAGLWTGSLDALMPDDVSNDYRPRTRVLARDELAPLLFALSPDRAAIVAFIVGTGARLGEALRARREDIAPDRSYVRLRGTKTALSARTVPLVGWGRELVEFALAGGCGRDGLVFSAGAKSVGWALRRACVRAGIPRVSANDLRRTYATWLREAGAPPALIAPAMGHADSRMVERVYGRLDVGALGAQLAAHVAAGDAW
jgi:integrase